MIHAHFYAREVGVDRRMLRHSAAGGASRLRDVRKKRPDKRITDD
jgi:hypothetical protein